MFTNISQIPIYIQIQGKLIIHYENYELIKSIPLYSYVKVIKGNNEMDDPQWTECGGHLIINTDHIRSYGK